MCMITYSYEYVNEIIICMNIRFLQHINIYLYVHIMFIFVYAKYVHICICKIYSYLYMQNMFIIGMLLFTGYKKAI